MSRRRLALALGGAGVVLLAALAVPALLGGLRGGPDLPTAAVARGRFVHEIEVDGLLAAETATALPVPRITGGGALTLAWTADDGSRVREGDVVVRFDATQLEQQLLDGQAEQQKAVGRRRQKEVEEGTALDNLERDARIAELQLDHSRSFQTSDPELYSRIDIVESTIDQELAEKRLDHVGESRELRQESGALELELLDLERERADLEIERAEAGLSSLEIRAPHDGIFVLSRRYGYAPQIGDQVYSGQPIGEIPQLDRMKAVVYVLEADAGGVRPGLPVRVVPEAWPGHEFAGEVRTVAAVARPRTRYSPVQYFEVEVALAETDPERMKPGQRVRATLVIEDESEVLTIPREAVFEDGDGGKLVYRRVGGRFEPTPVGVAATAPGRVVVEDGLTEGDVVALADPRTGAGDATAAPTTDGAPVPGPGR